MPRIIAGALGGRTIPAPPSSGTRPTSDRVREAIFSRLTTWDALADARVLDLFAGTGALAFEALSRGATSAVLIESHARTARQIERTAQDLGLAARTEVLATRAQSAVASLLGRAETHGAFDLVFADPPYDMPTAQLEQLLDQLAPALATEALVVLERSARDTPPRWPEGFAQDDSRTYGDTLVLYGGPVAEEGA